MYRQWWSRHSQTWVQVEEPPTPPQYQTTVWETETHGVQLGKFPTYAEAAKDAAEWIGRRGRGILPHTINKV